METTRFSRILRVAAMAAVWLSLLAPWYPFSDGGAAPGWLALLAAFVSTSTRWLIYRLGLVALTIALVVATLIALDVAALLARVRRWQVVLLLAALAFLVAVAPARAVAPLGTLWGVWLTAMCLGAAIVVEVVLWAIAARRQARRP